MKFRFKPPRGRTAFERLIDQVSGNLANVEFDSKQAHSEPRHNPVVATSLTAS